MNFLNDLLGIDGPDPGLGKVALRIEFPDNEELFRYLDTNKQIQQFVKAPNSKNPRDPETQSRLQKIVANAKGQPAPPLPAADLESDSGVVLIPIDQIFTDHKNFQNRETDYSSDSVNRILQAIGEGSFRWSMFDPITVWADPADGGKLKILSGHSRTEAFRQAAASRSTAEGKDFSRIPAKIFTGTLEEAKELARTSNNLSTKETEVERAIYYREKRMAGTSQKEIRDLAAKYEGKNAGFIINLSYLSPAGKTWDSLRILSAGTESENSRTIKEIADWIGEARRKFPDLTNGHENEIFDWLFGGAFSRIKGKRDYLERLSMAIQRATQFGVMDERLNIENRSLKTASEIEYDEKVEKARADYNEAEKVLKEKRKEFISRGADPNRLESYLLEYQAAVNNALRRLNELVKIRDQVRDGAKNQMSLFGLGSAGSRAGLFGLALGVHPETSLGDVYIIEPERIPYGQEIGSVSFNKESFNFFSKLSLKRSKKKIPENKLQSSREIASFLRNYIFDQGELEFRESFHVLYLSNSLRCLGAYKVADGGIAAVLVDQRMVFSGAYMTGASAMILAHNHPSGSLRPSQGDENMTRKIKASAELLDFQLLDHIIVTESSYYSFFDNGLL